jgi:hypothetical protein
MTGRQSDQGKGGTTKRGEADHDRNNPASQHGLAERSVNETSNEATTPPKNPPGNTKST